MKKKTAGKGSLDAMTRIILDPAAPRDERRGYLRFVAMNEGHEDAVRELDFIMDRAAAGAADDACQDRLALLGSKLEELEKGPLRTGRFTGLLWNGRALVRGPEGSECLAVVGPEGLASELKAGDRVILDAYGTAILQRLDGHDGYAGETGRLKRRINGSLVEVTFRNDDTYNLEVGHALLEKLNAGAAGPGCMVVANLRERIAFDAVAPADGFAHYEFLDRRPVPEVEPQRDIGAPPECLELVEEHLREELFNPERRRRYRLPRSMSLLLVGASGTGKTLAVEASIRIGYRLMAERTGLPLDQIPRRVVRVKMSTVLSHWLGMSDKRADLLFDEALELYDSEVATANGERLRLPVFIVIEEADALGRARGAGRDHDGIYDRILATVLQRLDLSHPDYRDRVMVVICTSNIPDALDPAFFRRVGSRVERFGRLSRREAFKAVLGKHLRGRPFQGAPDGLDARAMAGVLDRIASHFYAPSRQAATELLEVRFAGGEPPARKGYRDFFTGAVVAQAVHDAARLACRLEGEGLGEGLSAEGLIAALEQQVASLVGQVKDHNAGEYVDLPEGCRVASARPLQPTG